MKTTKILILVFISMFLINLASSHDYIIRDANYNDGKLIEKINYHSDKGFWENEDREPIYDYRHGYTYRISKEYFIEKIRKNHKLEKRTYNSECYKNYYNKGNLKTLDTFYDFDEDKKVTQYKYIPYLNLYEKKKCYNHKPDKLFYVKCN